MIAETIPQLQMLSPLQKLELAAELWQSAMQHEDQIDDSPEVIALLKERLASHEFDGATGQTWEEVRAKILTRA